MDHPVHETDKDQANIVDTEHELSYIELKGHTSLTGPVDILSHDESDTCLIVFIRDIHTYLVS